MSRAVFSMNSVTGWLQTAFVKMALGVFFVFPSRVRVALFGWFVAYVMAPVLGWRKRMQDNLGLALPELSRRDRARLITRTSKNLGRLFMELLSPAYLKRQADRAEFEGPGLEQLYAAREAGQAVVMVSGHFGNYDVFRAGLIGKGFDVGALYRPMNNRAFNDIYESAIRTTGEPLFSRGRSGMGAMIRHLRAGKVVALLIDQHMDRGAALQFFGQTARTSLSAADMALKYRALLVPIYAIRVPDEIGFRVRVEKPIPNSTPEAMTQALNDSLEAQVRAYPDQWLWTHRRWKTRAAGGGGQP